MKISSSSLVASLALVGVLTFMLSRFEPRPADPCSLHPPGSRGKIDCYRGIRDADGYSSGGGCLEGCDSDYVRLRNGARSPVLLFDMSCQEASSPKIASALESGYRGFHVGEGNSAEAELGNAIVALAQNSHEGRSDFFLQAGIMFKSQNLQTVEDFKASVKNQVISRVDDVLKNLQTEYLDSFMLKRGKDDEDAYALGIWWDEIALILKESKVRAVGLSGFKAGVIESLMSKAEVLPFIVEPLLGNHFDLRNEGLFLREHSIVIQVPPLVKMDSYAADDDLYALVDSRHETVEQLALRFAFSKGLVVLTCPQTEEEIKQNIFVAGTSRDPELALVGSQYDTIHEAIQWTGGGSWFTH
mmetsp:Transcript_57530/g.130358  ORF Transcript_57530/g.130358 Transcript_57530/m.130358 type:complete len:358 (+) Transcript_57530:100-1173(+)|eukprot:CAMPEP_0172627548 /NCGR_PEP_ID=MMETSP1068-20121228/156832_1 /TAXON_ID=35684 /ORGANISM="Pseudopedinella elastica, Strain CCMP716" /LENGTH=357 /DNA_ID=CAMNT_0013437469 /DNA_START=80 /DNA_END=1153 /DNA_ORIENTATION=-